MGTKGYTLIEILVAVGIFTVVIAAPTGFLVGSLKGQQKALSSQELTDNISYTLEYMSRALRMAKKDKLGNCLSVAKNNYETDPVSKDRVRFINYRNKCQEFFLDSNRLKARESLDNTAAHFQSSVFLTSDDLEVVSFKIGPTDSWDQADNEQPRVTLFLEVKGARGSRPELQPEIKIQTTISQRNLDVTY